MTSGTEARNYKIILKSDGPLNIDDAVRFVKSPKCATIENYMHVIKDTELSATGTISPISAILYEAYESNAFENIANIIDSAINDDQLESNDPHSRAYVGIRLGRLPVGEVPILICISATCRRFAHKSCIYILDKLLSLASIWRKIIFADGHEEWADGSRSDAAWLGDRKKSLMGNRPSDV